MATDADKHDVGDHVEVRDRRDLPFFQVHVDALRRIREHVGGPRRTRATGLYVVLCQLANEQRHWGDHAKLRASYQDLQQCAAIGANTVKQLLDALQAALVVRVERVATSNGATETVLHLPVRDGGWVAVTVAAVEAVADAAAARSRMRDLGAYVGYLELCNAQRRQRGGQQGEATRAQLAAQAGLSVDQLDVVNRVLIQARVLEVTERRPEGANRNQPSIYTLIEPPESRAGTGKSPGRNIEVPGREHRSLRAGLEKSHFQGPATSASKIQPVNARSGALEENGKEGLTPQPPVPAEAVAGGFWDLSEAEVLCEALCDVWRPSHGERPRRRFETARDRWLRAAAELLADLGVERLRAVIAYAPSDHQFGHRAVDMPTLSNTIDVLLARMDSAQQTRTAGNGHEAAETTGLPWPAAQAHLTKAAGKHGREGKARALAELVPLDPRFEAFIRTYGWQQLCERDVKYAGKEAGQLWAELGNQTTTGKEGPA